MSESQSIGVMAMFGVLWLWNMKLSWDVTALRQRLDRMQGEQER